MNALVEKGFMTEMACGSNFSYVLSDNSAFLSTEYKVLQSQANSCFVKCMKMLYNGKIQLFYLTKTLKPFSALLPSLDADSFLTIVGNLLADIIDVKHNGFLSCQNVDISFDKVFVDPATYKVSLVYVPVSKRIYEESSTFENEVRTGLVKLITGVSTLSTPKTMQLASDLSNGLMTIEDLSSRVKGGKGPSGGGNPSAWGSSGSGTNSNSGKLRIVAMNAPTRVEIDVTKDSFVIGKNASSVDGVISFNKMISRVHCRIDRRNGEFTITDLQSANGTYVNRVKLQPNQPHSIKNGDVIRLANSDFQVSVM